MYQSSKRVGWILIIAISVMCSCASVKKQRNNLCQHWVHAYEQDQGNVKCYVLKGVTLPVSRPRREYQYFPDGKVIETTGGRSDRGENNIGIWKWSEDSEKGSQIIVEINKNDKTYITQYKIVELTKDILKLEKL